MTTEEYFKRMCEDYSYLLDFLEDESEPDYNDFIDHYQDFFNDKINFKTFLNMIESIARNHRRSPNFIKRIQKIFLLTKDNIKKNFSSIEIFKIFYKNLLIIAFFIKNEIIILDNELSKYILNYEKYLQFNIPFIYIDFKPFLKDKERQKMIEQHYFSDDPHIYETFYEKQEIGENDSYICKLIREDSVEEFVSYVTKESINLTETIKYSLFETNQFLLRKNVTLIEYSAFCGSCQIFQYLRLNGVSLNSSLWLYAIHGNNPEIIHILEESDVQIDSIDCFKEAIKCHHNDIANYIKEHFMTNESVYDSSDFNQNLLTYCLHYCNFSFDLSGFDPKLTFCQACHYGNFPLVKLLSNEANNIDLFQRIILTLFLVK